MPSQFATRFAAQFVDALAITGGLGRDHPAEWGLVVTIVAVYLLAGAYYTCCKGCTGQTTGKRLLHIKVVDDVTGKPIGPPRALLRRVVSWVSFIAVLAGYFWMLGNEVGQTWHDQATHSLVTNE